MFAYSNIENTVGKYNLKWKNAELKRAVFLNHGLKFKCEIPYMWANNGDNSLFKNNSPVQI